MPHYERTEDCPANVSVVHAGPFDIEIPESGLIPIPASRAAAFSDAAQNGFFRKVDDDEVPEPDEDEVENVVPDTPDEPQTDAPVPDEPEVDDEPKRSIFS